MPLLEEYPIMTSLSRDKWQFKILIYVGIGKSIFSIYNFRQNFRFGFFPSSLMGFFTFVEWPTNDLWLFTATVYSSDVVSLCFLFAVCRNWQFGRINQYTKWTMCKISMYILFYFITCSFHVLSDQQRKRTDFLSILYILSNGAIQTTLPYGAVLMVYTSTIFWWRRYIVFLLTKLLSI